MVVRILAVAALAGVAAFALWHPAPHATIDAVSAPPDVTGPARRGSTHFANAPAPSGVVVYVAGAVRRPGLYTLREGDRYDRAVTLAGGLRSDADATGVNLAQRAADGEEVLVPRVGEATYGSRGSRTSGRSHRRRGSHRRRHGVPAPAEGSVDVNVAQAEELSRVPGIGRAIAGRIIELRDREGAFTSLDELLDVAGMTQSRLARARPYLRELGGGAEGSSR